MNVFISDFAKTKARKEISKSECNRGSPWGKLQMFVQIAENSVI